MMLSQERQPQPKCKDLNYTLICYIHNYHKGKVDRRVIRFYKFAVLIFLCSWSKSLRSSQIKYNAQNSQGASNNMRCLITFQGFPTPYQITVYELLTISIYACNCIYYSIIMKQTSNVLKD